MAEKLYFEDDDPEHDEPVEVSLGTAEDAAEAFFGGDMEAYEEWIKSGADWPSRD